MFCTFCQAQLIARKIVVQLEIRRTNVIDLRKMSLSKHDIHRLCRTLKEFLLLVILTLTLSVSEDLSKSNIPYSLETFNLT